MRLKPQTYVLTSVTFQRQRIFQTPDHAELMISILLRHRELKRFLIHGFVVMPDHLHVALTPMESIEKTAQLVRGGFSFAIRKDHRGTVWQDGYHAHRIIDEDDYRNQLHYIAQNPIRKRWFEYPYVHTRGTWVMDQSPEYPGG
jgi:putative transposase